MALIGEKDPGSDLHRTAVEHLTRSATAMEGRAIYKAAEFGLAMNTIQARSLVDAILGHHDEVVQVAMPCSAHFWRIDTARESVRSRMLHGLLRDLLKHGKLPVALPTEEVIEDKQFGTVSVILSVPVRWAK